jgi:hydroxymethylglutaryl-CoA lyase
MAKPLPVTLADVTLRDGLQMESRVLATAEKLALFDKLAACGYDRLEVTSFINPKWVPQFADADDFCKALAARAKLPTLMAFVPNERGLERMLPYPITWACAFVATSEAFNKKNVNMAVAQSVAELEKIVRRVRAEGRKVRVYISTVFGCPYQGEIGPKERLPLFAAIAKMQPDEICLGDTIGVATPHQVRTVIDELKREWDLPRSALHFHNTYGLGVAAAMTGYELGVTKFDGATGGVGGCPYAKGASGNTATDDLAYAFARQGAYPAFSKAALGEALQELRKLGMTAHSALAEIQAKGGDWFGV